MALKIAMAVTGTIFVLFLLVHMYGNLKMFVGADAYNGYAGWMREFGYPFIPHEALLWILRVVLGVSLIVHVFSAITLWRRANTARGRAYKINTGKKVTTAQKYTGTMMRVGGLGIFFFIVFHILHFTTLHVEVGENFREITPYERMVQSFSPEHWYIYVIYFVALALITYHIRHGVWSALATLGLSRTRRERAYKIIADLVALAIFVGFLAPPTAILVGFIS
ncbi:Succinate dehydrogenase/fumarate reductase, cytochrome b subunit [Trueperella bialowiezensis]|uniref:Succinate dehydrogenase/fumarate reductase, cytochrome b subunit n=1 Tax=Trueperella bialowiezensis TaxID=312285 RepID=A0A448PCZ5_9ACTO|nr:Succinate dehydrogenase/fumarate reductase, cytochrome b subunit [Trueperella bialowiezensis]